MINLEHKVITRNGTNYRIKEFKCVFKTPMGIVEVLDDAIRICSEIEIPMYIGIRPVVMVVGVGGNGEIIEEVWGD